MIVFKAVIFVAIVPWDSLLLSEDMILFSFKYALLSKYKYKNRKNSKNERQCSEI